MLEVVLPLSKLLHYVGFSLAVGSAAAVTILRRSAARSEGERRSALEVAVGDAITAVEIPGVAIALFAGVLAVLVNPSTLDPEGPLGAWLFVKLPLVMAMAVVAFVKMFGARLLVRERANGASEAECATYYARGKLLDLASLTLPALILLLTTWRYVLFA